MRYDDPSKLLYDDLASQNAKLQARIAELEAALRSLRCVSGNCYTHNLALPAHHVRSCPESHYRVRVALLALEAKP